MSRIGIFPAIAARRSTMSRFVHLVTAANPVETVTDNRAPRSRRSRAASVSCLLAVLAISSLFFFSVAALAQSDVGTIVGFVKDQSGAVVPNATVTIRNEGTGELHTVTSDEQGHFVAPSLPPAYYSMTRRGQRVREIYQFP